MKILITGATGLIGKSLGLKLVNMGHELVVTSRTPDTARRQLPFPAEVIAWDPKGITLPSDIEGVVHLMGESVAEKRWSNATKQSLRTSRIDATQLLSKSIKNQVTTKNKLKFWIQASAVGAYGSSFDEKAESSPITPNDFLSQLTYDWEDSAKDAPTDRLIYLRMGVVMTHQGGAFPRMFEPFKNKVGGKLGDGMQWMSMIHLEDVVGFICHAIANQAVQGIYNLVCSKPITNEGFTHQLSSMMKVAAPMAVPAFGLKLALGEMATVVLSSQRILSERLLASGYSYQYPTVESILSECLSWYRHPTIEYEWCSLYYSEQYVPQGLTQTFEFFSDAKNLETLTPSFLSFQVLSVSTQTIGAGTEICYRLKVHGVPIHWKTIITVWEQEKRFVDYQQEGPYRLWHHEHLFESISSISTNGMNEPGTWMRDWVRYQLPMGSLGAIAGGSFVANDVEKIFNYRREKIDQLFFH